MQSLNPKPQQATGGAESPTLDVFFFFFCGGGGGGLFRTSEILGAALGLLGVWGLGFRV